jgi:hypothetical protein
MAVLSRGEAFAMVQCDILQLAALYQDTKRP